MALFPGPQIRCYFQAYDLLSDALYLINVADAAILFSNRAGLDDLQMTMAEVQQHTVFSLQRDVQDLAHWQQIIEAIRSSHPFTFVGRHVRKDGSEFPVEVVSHFVELDGREYLLSEVRDQSRRQQLKEQQRQREPLLSFALNEATDGMWDWIVPSGEVFFSPQLKRMLGYGPYEMPPVVETWKNNIHPDDLADVMQRMEDHLQGKTTRFEAEYRLANRNGSYQWMKDRGRVCQTDDQGRALRVVGMVHNIDPQKRLEQKLRDLATYDELTGLMNRRAGYAMFKQQLKLACRQQTELTVALLDLDGFKQINDHYGHQVGDKILVRAADCFRQRLRGSDLLMRWGGEEFLIVMPHTRSEDGWSLCDRLRQQLQQQPLAHAGQALYVSVSIGVTTLDHNEAAVSQGTTNHIIKKLVREADSALYQAKAGGKNRTVRF